MFPFAVTTPTGRPRQHLAVAAPRSPQQRRYYRWLNPGLWRDIGSHTCEPVTRPASTGTELASGSETGPGRDFQRAPRHVPPSAGSDPLPQADTRSPAQHSASAAVARRHPQPNIILALFVTTSDKGWSMRPAHRVEELAGKILTTSTVHRRLLRLRNTAFAGIPVLPRCRLRFGRSNHQSPERHAVGRQDRQ